MLEPGHPQGGARGGAPTSTFPTRSLLADRTAEHRLWASPGSDDDEPWSHAGRRPLLWPAVALLAVIGGLAAAWLLLGPSGGATAADSVAPAPGAPADTASADTEGAAPSLPSSGADGAGGLGRPSTVEVAGPGGAQAPSSTVPGPGTAGVTGATEGGSGADHTTTSAATSPSSVPATSPSSAPATTPSSTASTTGATGSTRPASTATSPSVSASTTTSATATTTTASSTTLAATSTSSTSTSIAAAPAPNPPAPSGDAAIQQAILEATNAERARAGCGPLRLDPVLNAVADAHSHDMAGRDYFSHTDPDGKGPGDRVNASGYPSRSWGENIAAGYRGVDEVMNGWMNSDGHRRNILDCGFDELGVGHAEGGSWGRYWTQVFATRR